MMHAAHIKTSHRLQRVSDYLSDHQWHSTRDIIHGAHVCAVNSIISELRVNGIAIECKQEDHRFYYRLSQPEQFEMPLQAVG